MTRGPRRASKFNNIDVSHRINFGRSYAAAAKSGERDRDGAKTKSVLAGVGLTMSSMARLTLGNVISSSVLVKFTLYSLGATIYTCSIPKSKRKKKMSVPQLRVRQITTPTELYSIRDSLTKKATHVGPCACSASKRHLTASRRGPVDVPPT